MKIIEQSHEIISLPDNLLQIIKTIRLYTSDNPAIVHTIEMPEWLAKEKGFI